MGMEDPNIRRKNSWKKILEIILFVSIILLSLLIFLERKRFQKIGSIGYVGVFLLCLISNASVFLPAPSMMVVMSAASVLNPIWVSLAGAAGSSCGELFGYLLGNVSRDLSSKMRIILNKMKKKIRNDMLLAFVLAVLPLPLFDLAGVYSGGTRMNLMKFFAACFSGKLIKMLLFAYGMRMSMITNI